MKLTVREQLFIKHYLIDLNQHQAAKRAGYKAWAKMSVQVMQKPEVRDYIRRAMEKRCKKFEAEAEKVIQDLADIAHLDRSQAFRVQDGQVIVTDTDLLPERLRRCISKVAQTQHGLKIEFDDRVKALELLGRHLALFSDNLNLRDNRSKPIEQMTEEEIDAEIARLSAEKTANPEAETQSTAEPA